MCGVDGIPCESLTLDETTTLLRGPAGSSVSLLVAPAGPAGALPRQLELERKALPQPAVRVSQGHQRAVLHRQASLAMDTQLGLCSQEGTHDILCCSLHDINAQTPGTHALAANS